MFNCEKFYEKFEVNGCELTLSCVKPEDNKSVKDLVLTCLKELKLDDTPGLASSDSCLNNMHGFYSSTPKSAYFVVKCGEKLLGGAGVAPLKPELGKENEVEKVCELQKMYVYNDFRSLGLGSKLMKQCLDVAKTFEYASCYLETTRAMEKAQKFYEGWGFKRREERLGNTGHTGCDFFYLKEKL